MTTEYSAHPSDRSGDATSAVHPADEAQPSGAVATQNARCHPVGVDSVEYANAGPDCFWPVAHHRARRRGGGGPHRHEHVVT